MTILAAITPPLERGLGHLGLRRTRRRRPAKIVVIGNVGNGNTGDEALLAATLDTIDPAAQVTVLSRNPEQVAALHGVAAVSMTPHRAGPALAASDAIIVVGGGMFGPGLPPLVRLLPHLVTLAAYARRDTVYHGIGVHRGMPESTLAALRRSARRSTVTVRDIASGRLLDPDNPPRCIEDLGWHLPPAPSSEARQLLRSAGIDLSRPLLLLAPKAAATDDKTSKFVAATDAALIDRIGQGIRQAIPRLGPNLRPHLAKAVTAHAAAVLGLRFHSIVFATATGTPATSFAWEPKTAAFLDDHRLNTLHDSSYVQDVSSWIDRCGVDALRQSHSTIAEPDTTRNPR